MLFTSSVSQALCIIRANVRVLPAFFGVHEVWLAARSCLARLRMKIKPADALTINQTPRPYQPQRRAALVGSILQGDM